MAASSASSRARTSAANKRERGKERQEVPVLVPVNANGTPLTKISFAASDLVPTDDYANVIIGPVVIERWYDLEAGDVTLSKKEMEGLTAAADQLGSVTESVLDEHREIVLTNLQAEAEKRLADAKK